jgi:hypothetical protein
MAGKLIITLEDKGECTEINVQRTEDMTRDIYKKLITNFVAHHYTELLELAKDVPVKEADTYENTNRN